MGFRFRKSIKVGKHFRINLSSKGVGYSVGGKGFRYTKTATGKSYNTYQIPGTGISYRQDLDGNASGQPVGGSERSFKPQKDRNTGFPNAIRALKTNGSDMLGFDMDANRDYLSVTIPIHPYFVQKPQISEKKLQYREKITTALKEKPLSKNELAKAMGYKFISAKFSAAVDEMLAEQMLVRVIVGNSVKIGIAGKCGGEETMCTGRAAAYSCHGGLVDFAAIFLVN